MLIEDMRSALIQHEKQMPISERRRRYLKREYGIDIKSAEQMTDEEVEDAYFAVFAKTGPYYTFDE